MANYRGVKLNEATCIYQTAEIMPTYDLTALFYFKFLLITQLNLRSGLPLFSWREGTPDTIT